MLFKNNRSYFVVVIGIIISYITQSAEPSHSALQFFNDTANKIIAKADATVDNVVAQGLASKLFAICKYPGERTEQEHKDAKDIFILRTEVMTKLTEKLRKPGLAYDTVKARAIVQFLQALFDAMDKYITTYTISQSDQPGFLLNSLSDRLSDSLVLYLRNDVAMSESDKKWQERIKHIYTLTVEKLYEKMPDQPEWTIRKLIFHALIDPVGSCSEGITKITQAMEESTQKLGAVIKDTLGKVKDTVEKAPEKTEKLAKAAKKSVKQQAKNLQQVHMSSPQPETGMEKLRQAGQEGKKALVHTAGALEDAVKYAAHSIEDGAINLAHRINDSAKDAAAAVKDSTQRTAHYLQDHIVPPCTKEHDEGVVHRAYQTNSYTTPNDTDHQISKESILIVDERPTKKAPYGYIVEKTIDTNVIIKRRKGPGLVQRASNYAHTRFRHTPQTEIA
jgi:hypothetical protein